MDEMELREIEKRWQMASIKPWYADHDYRESGANQILDATGLTVCFMAHDSSGLIDEFDTEFIANSVSDIPWLIGEIRSLQEALNEKRKKCVWTLIQSPAYYRRCCDGNTTGSNLDSSWRYCPICGGEIVRQEA